MPAYSMAFSWSEKKTSLGATVLSLSRTWSVTDAMTTSWPSLPKTGWKRGSLGVSFLTSPREVTTSTSSTESMSLPADTVPTPIPPQAIQPPTVENLLDGEDLTLIPFFSRNQSRSAHRIPASTLTVLRTGSKEITLFMVFMSRTMPPLTGMEPPNGEEPAPRTITGIFLEAA